ncbi:putative holin-like toxin [Enterococcus sp. DIV2359]|uniref:putative holin-like toxin n=1 Tax=Enterococcus sp. DIV2359 TaxID=2774995 RepID=UPI003D2C3DAB
MTVKFNDGGYPIESEVVRMIVLPKSYERRRLLPVETALALMISSGSLIATIIFGILAIVNNDKKK